MEKYYRVFVDGNGVAMVFKYALLTIGNSPIGIMIDIDTDTSSVSFNAIAVKSHFAYADDNGRLCYSIRLI